MLGSTSRVPTDSSVFETARNATVFFYPTLEHYKAMYRAFTTPFNTFHHATSLTTPASRDMVSANVDTLYSMSWLDLRAEPLILSVPRVTNQDGATPRYYSMQMVDAYTYNFAIISSRTTGNDPQKFIIAGPTWKGFIRPTIPLYQSKTEYIFLLGRTRVNNESDAEWVTKNIQPYYILTGYKSRKVSPQPANLPSFLPLNPIDTDTRDGRTLNIFERPEMFSYVNFLLGYMDIYDGDHEKFEMYSQIGIRPNISFSPVLGNRELYLTIQLGVQAGYNLIFNSPSFLDYVNGWAVYMDPPLAGNYSAMGGHDLERAKTAYFGLFALSPEEAYYPGTRLDSQGDILDCSNGAQYTITFPAGEPEGNVTQPGFWSVTMYGPSRFLVSNPINRYSIGDTTPDLYYDPASGSLTLYIQNAQPSSDIERRNWLPAPDGGFFLIMRLYLPARLDPPYIPPGVIKTQ